MHPENKPEYINGKRVPHELSVTELQKMLSSPDMTNFVLACEALLCKDDLPVYDILKPYCYHKDKYRRLYVLQRIFNFSEAVELTPYLEELITSGENLFVHNCINIVSDHNIKISEPLLVSAVKKHVNELQSGVCALRTLEVNDNNFGKIVDIFNICRVSGTKECICEVLCLGYLPEKAKELFDLFSRDSFPKIRLVGARLAVKYGFDTRAFQSDTDGHIRRVLRRQ